MTIRAQYEMVAIADIKEGDTFLSMPHGRPAWTALEDIYVTPAGNFTLKIRHHPDGGRDVREWSSLSARMLLPIARAHGEVST